MPANWENSSGHRTGKSVFISIPKKGNAKECHTKSHIRYMNKVHDWWQRGGKN